MRSLEWTRGHGTFSTVVGPEENNRRSTSDRVRCYFMNVLSTITSWGPDWWLGNRWISADSIQIVNYSTTWRVSHVYFLALDHQLITTKKKNLKYLAFVADGSFQLQQRHFFFFIKLQLYFLYYITAFSKSEYLYLVDLIVCDNVDKLSLSTISVWQPATCDANTTQKCHHRGPIEQLTCGNVAAKQTLSKRAQANGRSWR